jgi:hypothetical protein
MLYKQKNVSLVKNKHWMPFQEVRASASVKKNLGVNSAMLKLLRTNIVIFRKAVRKK